MARHSRPLFAIASMLLIAGATIPASINLAHAGECLAAPNSPAPGGAAAPPAVVWPDPPTRIAAATAQEGIAERTDLRVGFSH